MYKYRRIKELGRGGYGAAILVSKADNPNDKLVIKEVLIRNMSRAEQENATREVNFLKMLNHPNIVSFVESFVDNGKLCIVMGYADGGDLNQKIQARKQSRGTFTEDEVLQYFVQLCLALKHMHDWHVLHRDLKTQNVFLTSKGVVKLGDFGIAKALSGTSDFARTQIGTPYYLSPEICQDLPYNRKSDMWSLGCILYELMCLQVPFEAPDLPKLVRKIMAAQYTKPSPRFSKELHALLASLLEKDPKKRPTINQVLALPFMKAAIQKLATGLESREFGKAIAIPASDQYASPPPAAQPAVGGAAARAAPQAAADAAGVPVRRVALLPDDRRAAPVLAPPPAPAPAPVPAPAPAPAPSAAQDRAAAEAARHARALQIERDRQRLKRAEEARARIEEAARAQMDAEKAEQKAMREQWLARERERDRQVAEEAAAARVRAEAERMAALEERERRQADEFNQKRDVMYSEWEERQRAAQRNRARIEQGLYGRSPAEPSRYEPAPASTAAMDAPAAVERDRGDRDARDGPSDYERKLEAARKEAFAERVALRKKLQQDGRLPASRYEESEPSYYEAPAVPAPREPTREPSRDAALAQREEELAIARAQAYKERKALEEKMKALAQANSEAVAGGPVRRSPSPPVPAVANRLAGVPSTPVLPSASPAAAPSPAPVRTAMSYEEQLAIARAEAARERAALQKKMQALAAAQAAEPEEPEPVVPDPRRDREARSALAKQMLAQAGSPPAKAAPSPAPAAAPALAPAPAPVAARKMEIENSKGDVDDVLAAAAASRAARSAMAQQMLHGGGAAPQSAIPSKVVNEAKAAVSEWLREEPAQVELTEVEVEDAKYEAEVQDLADDIRELLSKGDSLTADDDDDDWDERPPTADARGRDRLALAPAPAPAPAPAARVPAPAPAPAPAVVEAHDVERLRAHLEQQLGLENMLEAYLVCCKARAAGTPDVGRKLAALLGNENAARYQQSLMQLAEADDA